MNYYIFLFVVYDFFFPRVSPLSSTLLLLLLLHRLLTAEIGGIALVTVILPATSYALSTMAQIILLASVLWVWKLFSSHTKIIIQTKTETSHSRLKIHVHLFDSSIVLATIIKLMNIHLRI